MPGRATSVSSSARLPMELLSEIFLQCVEDKMDKTNTIDVPLLLSSTCSRWRDAAIDTHRLWSRLSIQLTSATSESLTALVDTWFSRSGECPLTVYVFWEGLQDDSPFQDSHPVLDRLMAHSERWKVMFFYLPFRAFKSFASVRNRLPLLTDLSLGTDDNVSLPSPENQSNMFEFAPRLRSLECINFSPTILRFPWAQLKEIPVVSGSIPDCLDILNRGIHLSKISVIFVEGSFPAWTNTGVLNQYPSVNHHHLTCLTIMTPPWNEVIDLSALFPRLNLPYLESLTICNLHSTFGPEFTSFLSRLPSLKTLHLRKTALPDDQLVEGLKHLSSLTSLIVLSSPGTTRASNAAHIAIASGVVETEPTVTRYLLEALTRNFFSNDAMDGMLLPRLKKLELTVNSTAARELDSFIDMFQSRLRDDEGLARLEQVSLRPCVDLADDFLVRLVELKDFGLDVVVENLDQKQQWVEPF
ncbi:hypothetical protein D9613_009216 [Agrocybe pediades]|uniref:F-box domain-containing protein n=1 Tax=Agrocybe pediades TaxID=84607 RepID=A0A8H4R5C9_9AGAR|nr:hypothetical protein D9613_009216 [Agrocybe pediades]